MAIKLQLFHSSLGLCVHFHVSHMTPGSNQAIMDHWTKTVIYLVIFSTYSLALL